MENFNLKKKIIYLQSLRFHFFSAKLIRLVKEISLKKFKLNKIPTKRNEFDDFDQKPTD